MRPLLCDDLHPQFPCGLQESDGLTLDFQDERQVLNFDGYDGVAGMRPTKGGNRDLGEFEVFDFPGFEEDKRPDYS